MRRRGVWAVVRGFILTPYLAPVDWKHGGHQLRCVPFELQRNKLKARSRAELKRLACARLKDIDVQALSQALETAKADGVSEVVTRAAASNLRDAIRLQATKQ